MHIYLIGQPGAVGGASTEAWHTVRLWRRMGIDVTCVPTWKCDATWQAELAAAGVKTRTEKWGTFHLPDEAIAVSFCNQVFVKLVAAGRLDNCRTVYAPCMTQWTDGEQRLHIAGRRFTRYVFQSDFQRFRLWPLLRGAGVDPADAVRIHGYIEPGDFPFLPRPRAKGGAFTIGRISRGDPRKFHAEAWAIYDRVRREVGGVQARVLGWSAHVERKLGPPPPWAETLSPGAEGSLAFYRSLHLLVQAGGEAEENWPRYCLEAMAAGVPVVTDRRGGIAEMLCDPVTARLCNTPDEIAWAAVELARDDRRRLTLARTARWAVEEFYGNPRRTRPHWIKLFEELR